MEQHQNHHDKMYHNRHHKNTGSIEWPWLLTPSHTAMPLRHGWPPKVTYPGTSVMELSSRDLEWMPTQMPWMMATLDLPPSLAVHGTSNPRYHQMPQLEQTANQEAIELAFDTNFTALVPPLPLPPPSINYYLQNNYPLMWDRDEKTSAGGQTPLPSVLDVEPIEGLDHIVTTLMHTNKVVFDDEGIGKIPWEKEIWDNYYGESSLDALCVEINRLNVPFSYPGMQPDFETEVINLFIMYCSEKIKYRSCHKKICLSWRMMLVWTWRVALHAWRQYWVMKNRHTGRQSDR